MRSDNPVKGMFNTVNHDARSLNRDLFLDGECLKISYDKQLQRFVLFLVKCPVKETEDKTDNNYFQTEEHNYKLPPIEKFVLRLRILVAHNSKDEEMGEENRQKLYTLPESILDSKLTEKMSIFVIPSENTNPDETFIVLDDPSFPVPQSYFFKLSNLA